jgi:hypothetical protein
MTTRFDELRQARATLVRLVVPVSPRSRPSLPWTSSQFICSWTNSLSWRNRYGHDERSE